MSKILYLQQYRNLIEIQQNSYCWFLKEGLSEEFETISPIHDFKEKYSIHIYHHEFKIKYPRYNDEEVRYRDSTYSIQIYIPVQFFDKKKKLGKRKLVFFAEIPLMTQKGTFIINGCERVIVNQLIRSPGLYYRREKILNGKKLYSATIIPARGNWLKVEIRDSSLFCLLDNKNGFPFKKLLLAFGFSVEEILLTFSYFSNSHLKFLFSDLIAPQSISLRTEIGEKNFNLLEDLNFQKLFQEKYYNLGEIGRMNINRRLKLKIPNNQRTLVLLDFITILKTLANTSLIEVEDTDIDDLKNRRIRSVGELLQYQLRIGLNRAERSIKINLSSRQALKSPIYINSKPIINAVKEFFASSQLSQFLDQINPLSELTHKRRISTLGPGGLNRDRVSFSVREIHPSYYGKICPIETPEGQSAGLITSLTTLARVNKYGFLETPYYSVKKGIIFKTKIPLYLNAEQEYEFYIAPADTELDSRDLILNSELLVRYQSDFHTCKREQVNLISVSPIQMISIATALVPFVEHNDANRALMGSNMQRQSVPLLYPKPPIIGTGLEAQIAVESGMVTIAHRAGKVNYVSSDFIEIQSLRGIKIHYYLKKYIPSNQDTCINQRPIVWPGEFVYAGQIIADGPGTNYGELSLGQNILVAYLPWEGYNYEDAILISERLVFQDLFTSIHIENHDVELEKTKAGPEELKKNIPYLPEKAVHHLDEMGIAYEGTKVKPGDILVGKVTPVKESDQLPEGRLLRAIFGAKIQDFRDTSLRVPNGAGGRVIKIRIFTRENGDEIPESAIAIIRIFIAQTRKIQIGDKMAGRHGNKGIISKILPQQDMPFLPDGRPIDIVLNPLGIPSRMNVGQLYECLLGFAADELNTRFKILPFDEMFGFNASRTLILEKLQKAAKKNNKQWIFNKKFPGKIVLKDGRTGKEFDNPITVGKAYMLKLIHLVDDKIHARSTGSYSLVTQQPLGGRSRNGGQRFGEMEVWALEAFGAAYTLRELLTIKSDDLEGRNGAFDAIICGHEIPPPDIPESLRVLIKELQCIGINIAAFKISRFHDSHCRSRQVNLMALNLNIPNQNEASVHKLSNMEEKIKEKQI